MRSEQDKEERRQSFLSESRQQQRESFSKACRDGDMEAISLFFDDEDLLSSILGEGRLFAKALRDVTAISEKNDREIALLKFFGNLSEGIDSSSSGDDLLNVFFNCISNRDIGAVIMLLTDRDFMDKMPTEEFEKHFDNLQNKDEVINEIRNKLTQLLENQELSDIIKTNNGSFFLSDKAREIRSRILREDFEVLDKIFSDGNYISDIPKLEIVSMFSVILKNSDELKRQKMFDYFLHLPFILSKLTNKDLMAEVKQSLKDQKWDTAALFLRTPDVLARFYDEDFHTLFQKLNLTTDDYKNLYNSFVNQPDFLDIIKTEKGAIFFKELSRRYRSSANFDQTNLLDNISGYINSEYEKRSGNQSSEENKKEKADIEILTKQLSSGNCRGLSFLYAAYKAVGKEDIFFWKLHVISSANLQNLSWDEKDVFEEIASQVMLLQSNDDIRTRMGIRREGQAPIDMTMQLLSPGLRMMTEFTEPERVYNRDDLTRYVSSIPQNKPIKITSHSPNDEFNHAMTLYRSGDQYFFYDPNSQKGEISFNDPNAFYEVIDAAMKNIGGSMVDTTLRFDVFNLTHQHEIFQYLESGTFDPTNSLDWARVKQVFGEFLISDPERAGQLLFQALRAEVPLNHSTNEIPIELRVDLLNSYALFLLLDKPFNKDMNHQVLKQLIKIDKEAALLLWDDRKEKGLYDLSDLNDQKRVLELIEYLSEEEARGFLIQNPEVLGIKNTLLKLLEIKNKDSENVDDPFADLNVGLGPSVSARLASTFKEAEAYLKAKAEEELKTNEKNDALDSPLESSIESLRKGVEQVNRGDQESSENLAASSQKPLIFSSIPTSHSDDAVIKQKTEVEKSNRKKFRNQ